MAPEMTSRYIHNKRGIDALRMARGTVENQLSALKYTEISTAEKNARNPLKNKASRISTEEATIGFEDQGNCPKDTIKSRRKQYKTGQVH